MNTDHLSDVSKPVYREDRDPTCLNISTALMFFPSALDQVNRGAAF